MIPISQMKFRANVLGRWALASLFILGGINKIVNYEPTIVSMSAVGLVPASLLLPLVIILELAAGAVIAFRIKGFQSAALILAAFTLATNYFFHDFWTMTGERRALELSLFFKNVTIAGALLFFATANHHEQARQ